MITDCSSHNYYLLTPFRNNKNNKSEPQLRKREQVVVTVFEDTGYVPDSNTYKLWDLGIANKSF